MVPTTTTQAEHIARIRAAYTKAAGSRSQINLRGTLELVAKDLNASDQHFILELIQNAEDNCYGGGVEPRLEFIELARDPTGCPGSDGALLIVNNERGFRPAHVEALCSATQSTKQRRDGYIGEKGIGFKSVFNVSRRPHIFSNGYRFRFDEQPDEVAGIGFIVPYWVTDVPDALRAYRGHTCILLPLKSGKRAAVARQLGELVPETILFLTKLRRLTIRRADQPPVAWRRDKREGLVRLSTGSRQVRYWLRSRGVTVPADMHEDERCGVATRTVSVAFPLDTPPPARRIFAFLPTDEPSALPFLVNADFLLSASREAIKADLNWNRWLRDNIAPTFIEAFKGLLERADLREQAYKYIPLAEEADSEFLQPVVEAIRAGLRGEAVVLTGAGELVDPERARLAPSGFRELLKRTPLPRQLRETPLVAPALERHAKRLRHIGVCDLSADELANCLADEDWLGALGIEEFASLYAFLSAADRLGAERLRHLPILPLEGGGRARADERAVYLPTSEADPFPVLQSTALGGAAPAFLDQALYERLRARPAHLAWLGRTLEVRELTPSTYCRDLAQALDRSRAGLDVATLVAATTYIRDHYDDLDTAAQEAIRRALPLALADGTITPTRDWTTEAPLVMPAALDPHTGWQLVFADSEDREHMAVLADAYLAEGTSEDGRDRWRRFFEKLGATGAPQPRPVAISVAWRKDPEVFDPERTAYEERVWEGFRFRFDKEQPRRLRYPYPEGIVNYRPPRWLADLAAGKGTLDQKELTRRGRAVVAWLSALADGAAYKPPCSFAAHYGGSYRGTDYYFAYTAASELKDCLLHAAWFPTTRGPVKPAGAFLDKPEVSQVFGDKLPYALEAPRGRAVAWLGVHESATVEDLLAYLRDLAAGPPEGVDGALVVQLYRSLAERWRDDLREQFEAEPLIYVARPRPRWVTAREAMWPELGAVFGDAFAYLEAQYGPRLREFFVARLQVAVQPAPESYAQALLNLTHRESPAPGDVEAALERIYPQLLKGSKERPHPAYWQELVAARRVWTKGDRFAPADEVFIPDDPDLEWRFAEEGVSFCWRPAKESFAAYRPLYEALGVKSLADEVAGEVCAGALPADDHPPARPLLTAAAKRAVCYYLWHESAEHQAYTRAKESGLLAALLATEERSVPQLDIRYTLRAHVVRQQVAAFWDAKERRLYRLGMCGAEEDDRHDIDVSMAIARRFARGAQAAALVDFLGSVLHASVGKVDELIRQKGWHLPEEELGWLESWLRAPGADTAEAPGDPSEATDASGGGQTEPGGADGQATTATNGGVPGSGHETSRGGDGPAPPPPPRNAHRQGAASSHARRGPHRDWDSAQPGGARPGQGTTNHQTGPHVDLLSEVDEAFEVIAEHAGKRRAGRGARRSAAERRAIEEHAMERATMFYVAHGWRVKDVSANHSYDLRCTRAGGDELHVEVKGTTTDGAQILLTPKEVQHARDEYPAVALCVVAFIHVEGGPDDPRASGGQISVIEPWYIDEGQLIPVGYTYVVPASLRDTR